MTGWMDGWMDKYSQAEKGQKAKECLARYWIFFFSLKIQPVSPSPLKNPGVDHVFAGHPCFALFIRINKKG
jgi:hypothetical protein